MDKLKLVKIIVCVLTFLLVFGTLLLFGSIYQKTRSVGSQTDRVLSLAQPQGSHIAGYSYQDGKLVILIKDGGLADRLLLLDTADNRVDTTVYLTKE